MWESKVAPLSGVLFGVLLIAAFAIDPNTDFMPTENEVIEYLEAGPVRVMASAYLGFLAAFSLLWFSGSALKALRRMEDDEGRLSVLAFGGGVAAASLLAVSQIVKLAGAERVWAVETIDPGAAAALFDVTGIAVGNGVPMGLAALIGAAAIVMLRSGQQRSWVPVASLILAIGLVSPYAWAVVAFGLIWVAAAGIWMYRAESSRIPVPIAGS